MSATKTGAKKNLFASAKPVAGEPPKAKGKKDDRREYFVPGLQNYAVVTNAIKNLEAVQEVIGGEVKEEMRTIFLTPQNLPGQPKNFRGTEGKSSASCELRKRSDRSVLSPEEVAVLEADNIPVKKVVKVPERFVLNIDPNDEKLALKVSEALAGIKGLPEDFIQRQPEESVLVVGDETMKAVFASAEMAAKHFDIVTTLAIKPKLNDEIKIADVLEMAKGLVSDNPNAEED